MGSEPAITDERIEALRQRLGVPAPHPQPPWYRSPGPDAFRHVAEAIGDDNPLWCDPEYATASVWGGPIASPSLNGGDTLIGENEVVELDAETRTLLKGDPLKGAHAFYSASAREWWRPLRPTSGVTRRNALVGALDKTGDFAGRTVHEWTAEVFGVPQGMLSAQYRLMIRTDRTSVERSVERGERASTSSVDISPYSAEHLAAIDDAYRAEPTRRRGSEPRWWEDVAVGDEVTPLVKGPLRVTDMIVWHTGMGMGLYGVKALRLSFQQRQRTPGFFRPDDLNIPDVYQRVHWDQEWARRAGNPAIYDYGRMREAWLIHLCTDWMGDDAWLWTLDVEFRKFNYVGDTHWMRGTVTKHYLADGDRPAVDVEIWGENQRGEITCPGHATILLPSKRYGAVRLPDTPDGAQTCQDTLDALVRRVAETGSATTGSTKGEG